MGQNDDSLFSMSAERLSEQQIERLLRGETDPSQFSGPLSDLAALIAAARIAATADELAQESSVLASFKDIFGQGSVIDIANERRQKLHGKLLATKVAGVLIAATALTGTAVAAYHGDLPSTFQTTLSTGLTKVGISVPGSQPSTPQSSFGAVKLPKANGATIPTTSNNTQGGSATAAGRLNSQTTHITGGLINNESVFGLCIAYFSSQGAPPSSTSTTNDGSSPITPVSPHNASDNTSAEPHTSSPTAFQRLQTTAQSEGETVGQFCTGAVNQNAQSRSQNYPASDSGQSKSNTSRTPQSSGRFSPNTPFFNPLTTTSTTSLLGRGGGDQQPSNPVGVAKSSGSPFGNNLNETLKGGGS